MTKECNKCREIKGIESFSKHSSSKDGRQTICKTCSSKRNAAYYLENREKIRSQGKVWRDANKEAGYLRVKAWRESNPDKIKEIRKNYRKENREKHRGWVRDWIAVNEERHRSYKESYYQKNKDRILSANSEWKRANPHLVISAKNARRASKIKATPVWADEFIISEIYHLSDIRTKATGIQWHVDHIVPLKSKIVCGLHCEANLRVVTYKENLKKGNWKWPGMP